ncbi:transmembrane protein, putative (macronuclear) [Tetrahymena thermophila SB210]|uniref:Transmembrane protein, putative n=1 Tax=Tetrahymena thermophila (strain SB210) TaxID=312017 RepID=Q234W1_TETTS|nr:transmembrane protein, putative [Tetrahymena thermophila SB210]EAR91892.3 transmembrane protein, putative [Tetrahymena thermophila SB210]|eukprot:XP_001012137.3 transmembrane protein, putative [Tetrahymena thermophila SB210]
MGHLIKIVCPVSYPPIFIKISKQNCQQFMFIKHLLILIYYYYLFKLLRYLKRFYLNYLKRIQQNEAGSCLSCDQSCLKCQGPSNKDCIACTKNYILLTTLRKCALCEEGYFFNQSSCDQCDQTCLTCTGKNKQDCIDCRPGLILSSVSKTCVESSQVQNEQKKIKQSQETGCYDQKQQQVVSTCLDQNENSQSNTKILETLFIVNLSLIAVSSIFAPLGSSLGWIFIQNQQLLGNYIFAYKLVPLWMNQLEMKSSYAHHFFTMISNIVIVKTNNEAILFQFKQFDTLFTINDFWNSFLNNCFVALIVFGFCLGILIIFFCLNLREIQEDQNNSLIKKIYLYIKWNMFVNIYRLISSFLIFNLVFIFFWKKDFGMSDLISILVFSIFYLILYLYWNTIIGCKYQSIPYKDIAQFSNLVQNIEISNTSQRIFWLLFEWKKVIITVIQAIFIFDQEKLQISCWIHIGLNSLFIIYIFIQNPFIERTANSIIIVQELIYLTAIVFLGVIFSQDIEINPYNISELNSNMRNAYRIAMYVYLGLSIIVLAFILMQKVWNYFKILRKTNDMNKSQTTTGNMNMVEQMTDSNIEKLFEMLNQSKSKNQFHWKNQN